jgi:hypothetical protein
VDLDLELDCLPSRLNRALSALEQRRVHPAKKRLLEASVVVKRRPSPWSAWNGVDVEKAWVNIHAVEATLIELSPANTVAAKLPDIIADAQLALKPNDRRLQRLRDYAAREAVADDNREHIAEDVKAIKAAGLKEQVKARSFRNLLFGATVALTLFAILFAFVGLLSPKWVVLCGTATNAMDRCPSGEGVPTGGDVVLVELIGLLSASLVGSVAIRRMRGTSTPYAVPMASLLVKLPTGALTAVAGLLLIRAGVLGPAVANSTAAQLAAYALIFGASQQALTRLIDIQTQSVLDNIPSQERDRANEPVGDKHGT